MLHIIWWGQLGGIGLNLADLIGQIKHSGHTIDICVIQRSSRLIDSLSSQDVHVTEIGARSGFDLFALLRFCKFLRHHSFDIIHNHAISVLVTLGIVLAGKQARKVCQEHGPIRQHYRGAKRFLFYRIFRSAYHQFVAVSDATAKDLAWTGVPPDRVVVIPNPVDTRAFSPNICRGTAKERLGIPRSLQTVGTACRFAPEKDLPLFLEVAAIVAGARPDVRFVMVGAGDQRWRLQQKVEALHLTQAVHFTGLRTDMPTVWRAFDLYLFTSSFEPFGRTLLESLSSETPVVAAVPRDGGAVDLVHQSPGILAVEDRDPQRLAAQVLRLLDSPCERDELGRLGRLWAAEHYDVVRWGGMFESFYFALHNPHGQRKAGLGLEA
jgi:glycosyltransferase involved in cell wall biosynthesis